MNNAEKYIITLKKYWAENKLESPEGIMFLKKKMEILQLTEETVLSLKNEALAKLENAYKTGFELGLNVSITEFTRNEFIELCQDLEISAEDIELVLKKLSSPNKEIHPAKIEEPIASSTELPAVRVADVAAKFNCLGTPLPVSLQEAAYARLYKKFSQLAEVKQKEYAEGFTKAYSSLDDLVEKGFQDGLRLIISGAPLAMEFFVSFNLYEVDQEAFFKKHFQSFNFWEEAFEAIADRYHQIVLQGEQLDEYRRNRRESRGRWVGGGFGLGGAIKGAAMAGALNLVTGAAHMVFNGFGAICSSIGSSMEKSSILSDEKTLESLSKAIYKSIFCIHFSIIDEVNGRFSDPMITHMNTVEKRRQADAIVANLKNFRPGTLQQEKDLLHKALTITAYSEAAYEYILEKFGDEDGQIQALGEFFGIDVFPMKRRLAILEEKSRMLGGVIFPTIKDADTMRRKLLNEIKGAWGEIKESHVYFHPEIPEEKLEKAFKIYISEQDPEIQLGDILLLYDNTVLGSADEGFCLTPLKIFWKNGFSEVGSLEYSKIPRIKLDAGWVKSNLLLGESIVLLQAAENKEKTFPKFVHLVKVLKSQDWKQILASPHSASTTQLTSKTDSPQPVTLPKKLSRSFERTLEQVKSAIDGNFDECISVFPDLPTDRIDGVMNGYVLNEDLDRQAKDILFIYDNTETDCAAMGFCLFQDAIFWNGLKNKRGSMFFKNITKARIVKSEDGTFLVVNESSIPLNRGENIFPVLRKVLKTVCSLTDSPESQDIEVNSPVVPVQGPFIVSQREFGMISSINEAIEKAPPGSQIIIRPGTYRETIQVTKPVELVGEGPRAEIILTGIQKENTVSIGTSTAVLRGLSIQATKSVAVSITKGNITIENCFISGDVQPGLIITGNESKVTIRDCLIDVKETRGIWVYNGSCCLIEKSRFDGILFLKACIISVGGKSRCEIHDCHGSGVEIESGSTGVIVGGNISAVWVTNAKCAISCSEIGSVSVKSPDGKIEATKVKMMGANGMSASAGSTLHATECDIHSGCGSGITIDDHSKGIITDCTIQGGKGPGILAHRNVDVQIEKSRIIGHSEAGILIKENCQFNIRNCCVEDSKGSGIGVESQCSGTIDDSQFNRNATGISMENSSPKIINCRIQNSKNDGILIVGESQGVIENCQIIENGKNGIHVQGGNSAVTKCQIQRNQEFGICIVKPGTKNVNDCDLTENKEGDLKAPGWFW